MARLGIILINLAHLPVNTARELAQWSGPHDAIMRANSSQLAELPFLSKTHLNTLLRLRDETGLRDELALMDSAGVISVDLFDAEYPALLKEIHQPPLVLYVQGNTALLNSFAISIIGSRMATTYGRLTAEHFACQLAQEGITIISGLARGIDAAAHTGALKTGNTIAVLGSGLSCIYPPEHAALAKKIAGTGALVSEFSMTTPPLPLHFPRRNRIVSGLSRGVLVIEAALRSGALITARLAMEQNRDVFALPGKVDSPTSKGTHALLKDGAIFVDSYEDILSEYHIQPLRKPQADSAASRPAKNLTAHQKTIYEHIVNADEIFMEEIIMRTGLTYQLVQETVLALQMQGVIREVKPSCFAAIPSAYYAGSRGPHRCTPAAHVYTPLEG